MSLWSRNKPPIWAPHAVATPAGWTDPNTGELLVAITGLSTTKETGPTFVSLYLDKTSYKRGDTLNIIAEYTQAVTVTGTPQVTLSVNGSTHTVNYTSGSGTAFLKFAYAIGNSDLATAGQVTVTSPISLNGGTIKATNNSAHNAPLAFTDDASVALVKIDGTLATISSVAGITGAYVTGGTITATTTFSKAVTVVGAPQISLTVGANTRHLVYASGSGTTALVFRYVVVSGDAATAGNVTVASPVLLNGGTIKDANGLAATLTFTPPVTSAVTVN